MTETLGELMVMTEPPAIAVNAGASHASECSKSRACDTPGFLQSGEPLKEQGAPPLWSGSTAAADITLENSFQKNVEAVETRLQGAVRQAVKEIIDTLSKEAALRVVLAERKASILEQEHIYTKQQALAMMLRIKHSSDALLLDAEKRFLLEKRRVQELDGTVASLQKIIQTMEADLKRKGEILDEIQRNAHAEVGAKSVLMSPSEGVSKKRKGSTQTRPIDERPSRPGDEFQEDECNDTANVLASTSTRPLTDDLPSPLPGRSMVHSIPRSSMMQEHFRAPPATHQQASPASVRRVLEDGTVPRSIGHHVKDSTIVTTRAANQRQTGGYMKGTRIRTAETEEDLDSSDQDDSGLEGRPQSVDHSQRCRPNSSAQGEEIDCMGDGYLGLIALQASSPNSTMPNGHAGGQHHESEPVLRPSSGLSPKGRHDSDSSTDDEEEYQSRKHGVACGKRTHQSMNPGTSHHEARPSDTTEKVPKASEFEQTMVLRRSSGGKRWAKQQLSTEKPGDLLPKGKEKEKESKGSEEPKTTEIIGLPKSKVSVVDGLESSSSLLVESSRDSRRLMQGARQLLSLRKV